jgi:multicomponent K+:H+ antiporter subunit C
VEAILASSIAVLTAAGLFLMLRGRTFELALGLLLLSHAANLFVLAMGGVLLGSVPILGQPEGGAYPDPVPQALVLTAIVINFGVTTFVIVLAVRASLRLGTDRVDGTDAAGSDR